MRTEKIFALLSLLFKPSITMNVSNCEKSSLIQPSDLTNSSGILIPSDFMNGLEESDIEELLNLSIDSLDNSINQNGAEILSESENMSVQELISTIKIHVDHYFSSKKEKHSQLTYQAKSIIDEMIIKLSEADYTVFNRNTLNITEDFKISLRNILKQLIFYLKLINLNNPSILAKSRGLIIFREILLEFKERLVSFSNFLDEYQKKNYDISRTVNYSSKATSNSNIYDQEDSTPVKRKKPSNDIESATLSNSPENFVCGLMPSEHLFTCNVPIERDSWLVKSLCRSNAGIWYIAITYGSFRRFYILKVDQKNFNKNDARYELIRNYTIIENNKEKKIAFQAYCKKMIVNLPGTLYVLKYNKYYTAFEILALNSNFHLIKKFEQSSLTKHGLKEPFIEDIEIYENLLYMFCSENNCVIVTDFDFEVKHITQLNDFKFEKLTQTQKQSFKTIMDLIITEKSLYIRINDKLYSCENKAKKESSSIKIVEKALEIPLQEHNYCNNIERGVYVGNNSFILLPNSINKFLIFSKIISTSATPTCKSEIRIIDSERPDGQKTTYEIVATEDNTIYLVKGGPNIKLYKLNDKSAFRISY